jgi:hypothetical protein
VLLQVEYEREMAELDTMALLLASAQIMKTQPRQSYCHAAVLSGFLDETGHWYCEMEKTDGKQKQQERETVKAVAVVATVEDEKDENSILPIIIKTSKGEEEKEEE